MREKEEKTNYLNKLNRISPLSHAVLLFIMLIFAALVLIPLILVVVISFSSAASIGRNGYTFFPSEWTTIAYENLLGKGLGTQIFNSYLITIAYTVVER